VKRLLPIFRELLQTLGLTVGENTGLSGKTEKINSLACSLVLGTSTIDVGVDFKINFLIFESSDIGNFIQRLGRLGRHEGYQLNGETIKFEDFTAYALVPKFLNERLFKTENPPLVNQEKYDRLYFNQIIRENYRKINDFEGYYHRWGGVQSFKLYCDLGKPKIKSVYSQSREKFKQDCEVVFKTKVKSIFGRFDAPGTKGLGFLIHRENLL
jgi:CRISPR-associated endonuclease/helicase Cas3